MGIAGGTRLGPYEVVGAIGAGGMGEVYRARDTRLDRAVAIKVLPAEFATDAGLRSRFEREARIISQLEHPNICRLYDVGDSYLVMELLEGETLAERLARGPIPASDALRYGAQIAEALQAAHRRGIVHRDVKPGNVMLTKTGAKLLDFGLARPADTPLADAASGTATAVTPLTGPAVVVGTCAYMSPEQVRAEDLDGRSDIFSLGIVLYEMLSGRRPFNGRSSVDVMHAILEHQPKELGPEDGVSPHASQIVGRCLDKERDDRFQSAGDVAFSLGSVPAISSVAVAMPAQPGRRVASWLWPAIAALAVLIIAVVGARFYFGSGWRQQGGALEVTRFQISFPAESPVITTGVAISPDGRTIAYVRRSAAGTLLYLRSLASLQDAPVPGTEGAHAPFFSPDGTAVGFAAEGKLKKVVLADRAVSTIADSGEVQSATWGADRVIVYSSTQSRTLFRIDAGGGEPRPVSKLDRASREISHEDPQLLPENRTVLFAATRGFGTDAARQIEAIDLTTGKRKVIVSDAGGRWHGASQLGSFRWIPPGRLLFTARGRLHALRFDPERGAPEGDPVVVVDPMTSLYPFAISAEGTLVYFTPGSLLGDTRVVRVTGPGAEQPLAVPPGNYNFVTASPDERQLALTVTDISHGMHVATADLDRGTVTPISADGVAHIAIWTRDSSALIYSWTGGGPSNLVSRRADGGGEQKTLLTSANHQDPGSISPDGKWLAYAERDPATLWDIWLAPLDGSAAPRPYLRTAAAEFSPIIAPDGRSIAYVVVSDRGPAVFVDSFPQPSRRLQVADGLYPLWSRDGRAIYVYQDGRILSAAFSRERVLGRPVVVAEDVTPTGTGYGVAIYDVLHDGSLVLLRPSPNTITVALHWTSELDRMMAAAGRPQ